MKKFQDKHMEDYLEIFRDFEIKKREISPSKNTKVTIRLPSALMELFEEYTDETLKEAILQTNFAEQISILGKAESKKNMLRETPPHLLKAAYPSVFSITYLYLKQPNI